MTRPTAATVVVMFAGTSSPLALAARRVNELESACDTARELIVREMRDQGWSWQEVGEALGVTHQAARSRFRARGIK